MSDNTKQLYKKSSDGTYPKIFPLAFVQGIKDKRNNKELLSYINEINHFKVDYVESPETTRCQVDNFIRKKGLYITYYNTNTEQNVTEYFKGNQSDVTDDSIWGNSDNWELVPDKTYIESHAVIPNKSVTLDKIGDDILQKVTQISGTFNNRPNDSECYIGKAYFCTDRQTIEGEENGIMIYYKGDGIWVDSLGRTIT